MNESPVCIDANVVIWALVPSPMSGRAEAFFDEAIDKQLTLVAPTLLGFEVASVLRRLVYLRVLTEDEGEEAFSTFQHIPIRFSQRRNIFALSWQLAQQLNMPRAYDTAYLAVARLYGCELWTADEKLYNAVRSKLPWVKWLGEYG